MKIIIKSLILSPSLKKWMEYDKIKSFFKEREKYFDYAVSFIEDFYLKHDLLPDWEVFQNELSASGEDKFLSYLNNIINDITIDIKDSDLEFISYLKIAQRIYLELDFVNTVNQVTTQLSTSEKKSVDSIVDSINGAITNLHLVRSKVDSEQSTSSLVYGSEGSERVRDIYAKIKEKKHNDETIYYEIGFKEFDKIKIKKGDFIVIGGFTSQGKSVWARYILYRLLVEYGLNGIFFTFEMSHDICLTFFHLLHANNKKIFPGTPKIKQDSFKEGTLTAEEEDFLFNIAIPDFTSNPNYGTLFIDQPNKSVYTIEDLSIRLRQIENSVMPIGAVCVDYVTLMYPLISGRGKPDFHDYNQMIKQFKNVALTHRDRTGEISPFIAISPAQISRKGYDDALKNDGVYDISAIKQYSEFETSGDIVLTSLLTPEMRAASQIRLQNLKNRDGELIIEPVDLHIALQHGFIVDSLNQRTEEELIEVLRTLKI